MVIGTQPILTVSLPRYFLIERVYCQMLTSSAINHDLYWVSKALTRLVALSGSVPVSNITEDTPLSGVCFECHEDSPVVSSPTPNSSPCSDDDGTVITLRMLCRFEFSVYRCCKMYHVSGWRRESNFPYAAWKHCLPSQVSVHFIRFNTMYKLRTTSLVLFCLQHSSVLVTFPGHKSFCSCFGCDVTVCSVRYNVLLGMDCF